MDGANGAELLPTEFKETKKKCSSKCRRTGGPRCLQTQEDSTEGAFIFTETTELKPYHTAKFDCTYIESIKGVPYKCYARSSEDNVEKMENLHRKILPPEAGLKEELGAVQDISGGCHKRVTRLGTLPEPQSGGPLPCFGDTSWALDIMGSQVLFNSFKKPWMSKPRARGEQEHYSISHVSILSDPSFGNFVKQSLPLCPARDELQISARGSYTDAHRCAPNNFLPILHQPMFDNP
ncbi:hypothetical protein EDD85DRAFT_1027699 [Armillaria nabsnona]|nr:hypothetical protein EDD85DRAFT_1027699 [Armillaria nabsnona]